MSAVSKFWVTKDPHAVLPYGFDWTEWLETGDAIASATWTVTSPSDDAAPIVVDSDSETDTVATAVLSGGTAGNTYYLTCRITTDNGYIDDRTLTVLVANR